MAKTPERIVDTRNYLINGNMDFAQRLGAGGTSTNPNNVYTLDRWKAQFTGTAAGTVIQRQTTGFTPPAGSTSYMEVKATGGTNTGFQVGQQIEYSMMPALLGNTVVVSFYAQAAVNNAASTSLTVKIRTQTSSIDSTSTLFTATAITQAVTITTSWAFYSATFTVPSNALSLSVEFSLGALATNDGFNLTQVMLNQGLAPGSNFALAGRHLGDELALCQRYYEKTYNISVAPGTSTQVGLVNVNQREVASPVNILGGVRFKVTKRATPTVTIYGASGTVNSGNTITNTGGTLSSDVTLNPTFFGTGADGTGGYADTNNIGSNNHQLYHFTADAEF
jgi:hypothetical protein